MFEAACLLPCLLLLLLAGHYLYGLGVAADSARARARRCVWSLSMSACQVDHTPPACHGLFGRKGPSRALANEGQRVRGEAERDAARSQRAEGYFDSIEDWPLLGDAFTALFGDGRTATATETSPVALGDGPAKTLARTHWALCNDSGHSSAGVARQLFDTIQPL